MLFHRFMARIKRMAHKISSLVQSTIFCPRCESVHTGNTALSMQCAINRKTLLSQCFQQERKVQCAVGLPRRPAGCLSKENGSQSESRARVALDACEILIRLACAELQPGWSRTCSRAWFHLRLAHKLEGRCGRR